MNKLVLILVTVTLLPWNAFAACDWKTGISLLPDNNYEYTHDCHIKVGETVRDLGIAQKQVADLGQAITLKDLAISISDQRADLWMKTSQDLDKRIDEMAEINQSNKWIYFGLGVLATSAAIYGASRLTR